jgi:glycyl-tRNA synthetase
VEPALGLNRSLLAFLVDAYDEEVVGERERTVLRLHPQLAPVKAAVLPLIGKDAEMVARARALFEELRRVAQVEYDDAGAIGRRYRRQDEIGTPFCVTVDFDSLNDQAVTVRERDSMSQERVGLDQVETYLKTRLPVC